VVGFQAAALNGTRGVVVRGNAVLGRVVVLVDGDAKPKAFSFENLGAQNLGVTQWEPKWEDEGGNVVEEEEEGGGGGGDDEGGA
jgi:hypothetical protein